MKAEPRLAKADLQLIERAIHRDLENDVSESADAFSLLHTTDPRIEKLVAKGFFDAVSPKISGRRSIGYALTQKGRTAHARASM